MLIDPHFDPTLRRYFNVLPLLLLARECRPAPLIEIHRAVYVASGRNRQIVDPDEWERRFRDVWATDLAAAGL